MLFEQFVCFFLLPLFLLCCVSFVDPNTSLKIILAPVRKKFVVSREGVQVGRFNWAESPLADEPIAMGAGWTIREAIGELI